MCNEKNKDKDKWLKRKGYIHLTPPIPTSKDNELRKKVTNPQWVEKHAFFPFLHYTIKERKYKRISKNSKIRKHTEVKNGKIQSTRKERPIDYATHIDAHIYAYYGQNKIGVEYEKLLAKYPNVSECVTAYRKIKAEENSNICKSSIDFAKDVFFKIKEKGESVVLAFDIKSFFSTLNHKKLKQMWASLVNHTLSLPSDHYNIYKSLTNYSFIYKDDLRVSANGHKHFDERQLAINRQKGISAFFDSPQTLRAKIRQGEIRVYKNSAYNSKEREKSCGIPQGTALSPVLANAYMFDFDRAIVENIVNLHNAYYRRYSDDIIIICDKGNYEYIKDYVEKEIEKLDLQVAKEKTEVFEFRKENGVLHSYQIGGNKKAPLGYLGFEFYGNKILIKSSKLAKFYRRMKQAVKTKFKHLKKIQKRDLLQELPPLYKRKLYRIYSFLGTKQRVLKKKKAQLFLNKNLNRYEFEVKEKSISYKGNYLSYARRASQKLHEPAIYKQLRRHFSILQRAIRKWKNKILLWE